jgi:hypothetical protein
MPGSRTLTATFAIRIGNCPPDYAGTGAVDETDAPVGYFGDRCARGTVAITV